MVPFLDLAFPCDVHLHSCIISIFSLHWCLALVVFHMIYQTVYVCIHRLAGALALEILLHII